MRRMRLPGPADVALGLRDLATSVAALAGSLGQLTTVVPKVDEALGRIVAVADDAAVSVARIATTLDRLEPVLDRLERTVDVAADDVGRLTTEVEGAVGRASAALDLVAATAARAGEVVDDAVGLVRKVDRTATSAQKAVRPLTELGPTLTAVGTAVPPEQLRALLEALPALVAALGQVGPDVRGLASRVDDLHSLAVGLPGGKRLLRRAVSDTAADPV